MLIVSDDLALQYHSSHSGVLACSLGQQHCSPEMPEMPQNAHRRLHRLNVGLHAKTGCQALPPVDVQAPVWHQSQQKPQILHRSPSTAALAIWGVQQPVCTYNTDCSVCQEDSMQEPCKCTEPLHLRKLQGNCCTVLLPVTPVACVLKDSMWTVQVPPSEFSSQALRDACSGCYRCPGFSLGFAVIHLALRHSHAEQKHRAPNLEQSGSEQSTLHMEHQMTMHFTFSFCMWKPIYVLLS